jgi:hypothetical protein
VLYAFRPLLKLRAFEIEATPTPGLTREPLRGPDAFLLPGGERLIPKKAKPFQFVPVMALATADIDL